MNYELTGELHIIEDVVEISASFKKREFVVEVINEQNTDWNDYIKFQITQDRCNILDNFQLGQQIKVSFNIRGRKWEKDGRTNYFSNLEAWRIEPIKNEIEQFNRTMNEPISPQEGDLPF